MAFRLGLRGMPVEAEAGIVERDIALLRELNDDARASACRAPLDQERRWTHVRAARKQRAARDLRGDAAPLHADEEAVGEYDTHAKMNPPLRSAEDRDAMIEGIAGRHHRLHRHRPRAARRA